MKKLLVLSLFTCLLVSGAAQAKRGGEDKDHRSAFELARMTTSGGYFAGNRLVGYGSSQGYDGITGSLGLDVTRFPDENVGFELATLYGGSVDGYRQQGERFGRIDAALDFGLFTWSGPGHSGWSVGAGAGTDFGTIRLGDRFRAYPLLLSRLRVWVGRDVSLHLGYTFVPISTGDLKLRAHRLEAAVGFGFFQAGARIEIGATDGGDPKRTFVDRTGSLFAAFAVY